MSESYWVLALPDADGRLDRFVAGPRAIDLVANAARAGRFTTLDAAQQHRGRVLDLWESLVPLEVGPRADAIDRSDSEDTRL